jgi:hypothetical protein
MTNWIVNQGLEKHQYNAESGISLLLLFILFFCEVISFFIPENSDFVDLLLQRWKAAVAQSSIHEMWNPMTGEAYGVEGVLFLYSIQSNL